MSSNEKKISVNMSEFKVSTEKIIFESLGVGSCAVVCLYDPKNKIGGVAHIMLSKSTKLHSNRIKSAQEILGDMIKGLNKLGCKNKDLIAKIIGGASMYKTLKNRVGVSNIMSVKQKLKDENIFTISEDIFGDQGRNIWFNLNDGKVVISKPYSKTIEI